MIMNRLNKTVSAIFVSLMHYLLPKYFILGKSSASDMNTACQFGSRMSFAKQSSNRLQLL